MQSFSPAIRLRSSIPDSLIIVLFIITQGFGLLLMSKIPGMANIRLVTLFYFFLYYFPRMKSTPFYKGMLFMIVCIMASHIYNFFVYHQNLLELVCQVSWPFYGLISFYVLYYYKINAKNTLKIIKWICILVTLLYFIQWILYPRELVSWIFDEFTVNHRTYRPRTYFSLSCYCLVFLGIEEYIERKKPQSILLAIMGAIPCLIMGFRSLLLLLFIGIVLLVVQSSKASNYFKYAIILSVMAFLAMQTPIVQYKMDEMMRRQDEETFANKDYIRYASLDFYTTKLHKNAYEDIMGSGLPILSSKKNNYDNNYQNKIYRAYRHHFFWNDLGIIGLAIMIGIPAVFMMVYYTLWIILKSNRKGLYFARYTMILSLLGTIITSQEFYRVGNLIFTGFLLYYIWLKQIQRE